MTVNELSTTELAELKYHFFNLVCGTGYFTHKEEMDYCLEPETIPDYIVKIWFSRMTFSKQDFVCNYALVR